MEVASAAPHGIPPGADPRIICSFMVVLPNCRAAASPFSMFFGTGCLREMAGMIGCVVPVHWVIVLYLRLCNISYHLREHLLGLELSGSGGWKLGLDGTKDEYDTRERGHIHDLRLCDSSQIQFEIVCPSWCLPSFNLAFCPDLCRSRIPGTSFFQCS